MSSKKDAERQEEEEGQETGEEGQETGEEGQETGEEEQETSEAGQSAGSITSRLNAKMVALAGAILVVGVLVGQIALPTIGVGLVSLPVEGTDNEGIDIAATQESIQVYLNENVLEPQGVEGKVLSITPFDDDFYTVELEIMKDGELVGTEELYLTKSGKAISGAVLFLDDAVAQPAQPVQPQQPAPAGPGNVGNLGSFTDSGNDVELEDGKPVVRLFSTTGCPHCVWIMGTFDKVAKEYVDAGKIVAYHWELNTGDDTLTEAVETAVPGSEDAVYKKFNPRGSIPTFVFGGKYYRVGNGFEGPGDTQNPTTAASLEHLAQEEADFRAAIEALLQETAQ